METTRPQTVAVIRGHSGYRVTVENRSIGSYPTKAEAMKAAHAVVQGQQSSQNADVSVISYVSNSRQVRRRRRLLALLLTLSVFVAAVAVGAQFLKPLLAGAPKVVDISGLLISVIVPMTLTALPAVVSFLFSANRRVVKRDSSAVWAATLAAEAWEDAAPRKQATSGARGEVQ